MSQRRTKTKKTRKLKSPIIKVFSVILLLISSYLIYGVANELLYTFELTRDLEAVQKELETITAENEALESQKEKLMDPNYVQSFARGGLMVTKEGEKVFHLPSQEEE